jgi:hypothetical protein
LELEGSDDEEASDEDETKVKKEPKKDMHPSCIYCWSKTTMTDM